MPCNCLPERLAVRKAAEVERGAPPVLVEIGCEVVVTVRVMLGRCEAYRGGSRVGILSGQGSILIPPGLACLLCLDFGGFVVPMLEILGDCGLLRALVLPKHGSDSALVGGGLAMKRLVELRVTVMVFFLEGDWGHVEELDGGRYVWRGECGTLSRRRSGN
jgi:hypothetical protein